MPQESVNRGFIRSEEISAVTLAQEGARYFQAGRFAQAEEKFRQALFIVPDADNFRASLASTLVAMNLFDEAEQIYTKLQNKYPKSIRWSGELARLAFARGELEGSAVLYQGALDKALALGDFGNGADFARSLSVVHFALGEEEQARCASELSFLLNNSRDDLLRHAKLLIAVNDFNKARQIIDPYIEGADQGSFSLEAIRLGALSEYGLKNDEIASKLAREGLKRKTGRSAPELYLISQLTGVTGQSLSLDASWPTSEFDTLSQVKSATLLYWPARLVPKYLALSDSSAS